MTAGVHGGVLYGAKHVVVPYVAARVGWLDRDGFGPIAGLEALGVVRGDRLVGGVVFSNYRRRDLEVSIAFDDPRWARKGILARLFTYPFVQLGCRRITALVAADDTRIPKLMRGIGWSLEGRHRCAIEGDRDVLSFGMLREDCRWLPRLETPRHG